MRPLGENDPGETLPAPPPSPDDDEGVHDWERVLVDSTDPDHVELLDEFRATHAALTCPSLPAFDVIARRAVKM